MGEILDREIQLELALHDLLGRAYGDVDSMRQLRVLEKVRDGILLNHQ